MYTALIVEDSVFEQRWLEKILADNFPRIRVIGCCSSQEDGIKKIISEKPQLVFLDVRLKDSDGFELLRSFEKIDFEIIVITGDEHYAVKAFEFSAIDYVLKPITLENLTRAIHKFENKISSVNLLQSIETLIQNMNAAPSSKKKIALPVLEGFEFAQIEEIIRCEADDHYTWFHFANANKKLVTKNLKEYEYLLAEHNFFRVHNSHLINMNQIKKYVKGKTGSVVMNDGSVVDVSVRMKDNFLLHLKKQ